MQLKYELTYAMQAKPQSIHYWNILISGEGIQHDPQTLQFRDYG